MDLGTRQGEDKFLVSEVFQMYLVSQALILFKLFLDYRRPQVDYAEKLIQSQMTTRLAEINKMDMIE